MPPTAGLQDLLQALPEAASEDPHEASTVLIMTTMWHETFQEMENLVSSLQRTNDYMERRYLEGKQSDTYYCHIIMDNAWDKYVPEGGEPTKITNVYVDRLLRVVVKVFGAATGKRMRAYAGDGAGVRWAERQRTCGGAP